MTATSPIQGKPALTEAESAEALARTFKMAQNIAKHLAVDVALVDQGEGLGVIRIGGENESPDCVIYVTQTQVRVFAPDAWVTDRNGGFLIPGWMTYRLTAPERETGGVGDWDVQEYVRGTQALYMAFRDHASTVAQMVIEAEVEIAPPADESYGLSLYAADDNPRELDCGA